MWVYGREQKHLYPATEYILEILREKIYRRLNNELPYNISLSIKHWDNSNSELAIIHINIFVKSLSVKKIFVGTNGECMNYIIEKSKIDMELFFKKPVVLRLTVIPLEHPRLLLN